MPSGGAEQRFEHQGGSDSGFDSSVAVLKAPPPLAMVPGTMPVNDGGLIHPKAREARLYSAQLRVGCLALPIGCFPSIRRGSDHGQTDWFSGLGKQRN